MTPQEFITRWNNNALTERDGAQARHQRRRPQSPASPDADQPLQRRPAWLTLAHQTLDKAVAHAYSWTDYTEAMTDDEVLGRLLKLNLERAAK